jgi:hypothetical protein
LLARNAGASAARTPTPAKITANAIRQKFQFMPAP